MTSKIELDYLKSRLHLSEFIEPRVRLSPGKGDRFGLCPFHDEKTPSFSVNDRKGFYHCFGCGAHGDILDWWQRIDGMNFADAAERLRREAGARPAREPDEAEAPPDRDGARRELRARAIWNAAKPIGGTVAETYLRQARQIRCALPKCLRFHPGLRFKPDAPDELPAMVAAVTSSAGGLVAIQRTFLAPDGRGKAAIENPKRSLGAIARGAVCLAPAASVIGVAEGIETGLSAMELYQVPVWCALGSNLAGVRLPRAVRHVAIFADRGAAGESAAEKAREAFRLQGRKVTVRFPAIGKDFNDELKARHGS
jgi:DNA primase